MFFLYPIPLHYYPYRVNTYGQPITIFQGKIGQHFQFHGDITGKTYIGRLLNVFNTGNPQTDYIQVEVYMPPNNNLQVMYFLTKEISEAIPYTGPIPPYQLSPPTKPKKKPSPEWCKQYPWFPGC